jgi:hypothetical protein
VTGPPDRQGSSGGSPSLGGQGDATDAKLIAMTFCSDCNANLDGVPTGTSCPGCGGERRSATASPDSNEIGVTIPSPAIVAESNLLDGSQQTVVSGPTGRSASTSGGVDQSQRYEGRPTQNEENVADALHRLRDTLNQIAGSHVWQEHVGHEHVAIDGTLMSSDGRELRCQVTRVETSHASNPWERGQSDVSR